eukprot:6491252-Amphidinium_carterae.1
MWRCGPVLQVPSPSIPRRLCGWLAGDCGTSVSSPRSSRNTFLQRGWDVRGGWHMKAWLADACHLSELPNAMDQCRLQEKVKLFQELYGGACPQELCNLYNITLQTPVHGVGDGVPCNLDSVRGQFVHALARHVFRSEGHPVKTFD